MQPLQPDGIPEPTSPYSLGVAAGPFIFVAGQVPLDADGQLVGPGDVHAQTTHVIGNISRVLRVAGADLDHVVSTNAYLRDLSDAAAYNAAYAAAFGEHRPARVTVRADLVRPEFLVEISAIAIHPGSA